jgi:hypothetical protein
MTKRAAAGASTAAPLSTSAGADIGETNFAAVNMLTPEQRRSRWRNAEI